MIILALGSNLKSNFGNRFDNINTSIGFLEGYGIKLLKKSSFYETPSYPDKSMPKFINIVIEVTTNLKPQKLLKKCKEIEVKLGRKKSVKNSPRTCDIDIIDYNKRKITSEIILPHPRVQSRNFVLLPLFEINKDWIHPISKHSIKRLILSLSNRDIRSIKQI